MYIIDAFANAMDQNFSLDITLETSGKASDTHEYAATVASYTLSDGTSYSTSRQYELSFRTTDPYTVGDVDNDGYIDAVDARYALMIYQEFPDYDVLTLDALYFYAMQKICPTIVCAEAADANCNSIIDEEDSELILEYAASNAVGALTGEELCGTKYYYTVRT